MTRVGIYCTALTKALILSWGHGILVSPRRNHIQINLINRYWSGFQILSFNRYVYVSVEKCYLKPWAVYEDIQFLTFLTQ